MKPSASGSAIPSCFSAEHGEGLSELYEALVAALPIFARVDEDEEEQAPLVLGEEEDGSEVDVTKPLRIAVLGPPERRQIDAAQPHPRRGSVADRARSRA